MTYTGNEPIYPLNHRYNEYAENELGETLYSKTLREVMGSIVKGIYSSQLAYNSITNTKINEGFDGTMPEFIAFKADLLTKAYIDQLNKNQQP